MVAQECRLHIFDMDGTIIPSQKLWEEVNRIHFSSNNITYNRDEFIHDISGLPYRKACEVIATKYFKGAKDTDTIVEETLSLASDIYRYTKIDEHALEFIKKCKANGDKVALGTAALRQLVNIFLDTNNLHNLFDAVVTTDDVEASGDKNIIFDRCTTLCDIVNKDNVIIYEDSYMAIYNAINAGYHNFYFLDVNSYNYKFYIETQPKLIIQSFSELL